MKTSPSPLPYPSPFNADLSAADELSTILQRLEERREQRWKSDAEAIKLKLYWRACAIQHTLQVVPGETILEFGAGSGMLTEQLQGVLSGENPLTTISFSPMLFQQAERRAIPGVNVLRGGCLKALNTHQFDYVVGSGMLSHRYLRECLRWIHQVLKPGGQILFFEPSFLFPARLFNELRSRPKGLGNRSIDGQELFAACSAAGFAETYLFPHDIVSSRLGLQWMRRLQAKAVLIENMPVIRSACASVCLLAKGTGVRIKPVPNLADLPALYGAVSVVVPAYNEASNIPILAERLMQFYGPYLHEIVIVNDNSVDDTAAVVLKLASADARIRLVNRCKPNGVGLALRDGYRAATGRFILSMDCDFVEILPQLRSLFLAVAQGHDGAVGSRFSHESIIVNYPAAKLFFNRLCHMLIKLFLWSSVRDITNNLKLYRSEILQNMNITSPHFSANLETGLKPLLAGYDIVEVPISWINRTAEMGFSSFYLHKVGMAYLLTLFDCWRDPRTRTRGVIPLAWRALRKRLPW